MALFDPFLASIQLSDPIVIARSDGTDPIRLTALSEPVVIPEFVDVSEEKKHIMCPTVVDGVARPGNRVFEDYGSSINWKDLEFESTFIYPTWATILSNIYETPPSTCLYSPDNGTNVYLVKFKKPGGLVITNFKFNLRQWHKVSFKFYVLATSSVTIAS